jgi:Fe2+ transport system protein B
MHMMIFGFQARDVLVVVLAALFGASGLVNIRPPQEFRKSYVEWGYPSWWHYVSAACQLAGAVALCFARTRVAGILLLAAFCLAAVVTLFRHGQGKKSVPAIVFLIALASALVI